MAGIATIHGGSVAGDGSGVALPPLQGDYRKLVAEETLILQATEAICERMEEDSETASRKALAKKLGRSKGFVSQILSGDRNMTLRTLAQFADALGCTAEVRLVPRPAPPGQRDAA